MHTDRHAVHAAGRRTPAMRRRRRLRALLGSAALALGAVLPQAALSANVTLVFDTTPLAGTLGRFEFALLDLDAASTNTVTVANIASDGGFAGTTCSAAAGCSGGPASFAIDDSGGFGQLLVDLTLGTTLSLDLSFTTLFSAAPGSDPDRFVVSLLDAATNFSLVDTEITFLDDALLTIDLVGGGVVQAAREVTPAVGVTVVPEPGALALVALALLAATAATRPAGRRWPRPA